MVSLQDYTIQNNYTDWLESQKIPSGKKKTILSALKLFSSQGYHGTSTAQIASQAGISQATIFKYFKTKEELLFGILESFSPIFTKEFFGNLKHYQTLEDLIHFIVYDRFYFLKANQDIFKILLQELLINETLKEVLYKNLLKNKIREQLIAIFNKMDANNSHINPNLSLTDNVRTIFSPILFYFLQCFVLNIPTEHQERDLLLLEKQIIQALRVENIEEDKV